MTKRSLPKGQILGDRYRIEEEIGEGGMATVYLAEDLKHGRRVAVKVLKRDVSEAVGAERFLREIEIAASLTHPRILPLHDSGASDRLLYYVMPYIKGESLADRLSDHGPLPVDEATQIFRQIVDALGAAHEHRVVHRDVKPGNVLLTGGHALVADFGVARPIGEGPEEHRLTSMGVAMGTPLYMAPEQAAAESTTDHRADIFAAGAVAYEVLTGTAPFEAPTLQGVFSALMTRTPDSPHALRPEVPERLSDLIMACLAKDPAERPQSTTAVLARLDDFPTAERSRVDAGVDGRWEASRHLVVAAAGLVLATAAFAGWRFYERSSERDWALSEALPEIGRLVQEHEWAEAAQLALRAEDVLGSHPTLERYEPLLTSPYRIETDPEGAQISYRPYGSDEAWASLGTSPYESEHFPIGAYHFRLELDGYETLDVVRSLTSSSMITEIRNTGFEYLEDPSYVVRVQLPPEGSIPEGMVPVSGGLYGTVPVAGFQPVQPTPLSSYFIDRTEVTNASYAEFVSGDGYTNSSHWAAPFMVDGSEVPFADAIATLTDSTGRAGPAGWTLGLPPTGEGDFPVRGVSWYEAAAYCSWKGRELPTLFHWARAAIPSTDVWMPFHPELASASNFGGEGPIAVGSSSAPGISGAEDLAGNVREWVSTQISTDRYIVGGAWSDPTYWVHHPYFANPWDRSPTNGFRCALYPDGVDPARLPERVELPEQSLDGRPAISEAAFQAQRGFYLYDREAPLNAVVDSTGTTAWGGRWEWVTINTAYGERMPIRLHLPAGIAPPYEAMIYFGGGNTVLAREIESILQPLDQLVTTGRVLVEPIYDGTFLRNDGRTMRRLQGGEAAQLVTNWVKDVGRTIDYLETRDDIDATRVSYMAQSLGTSLTPYLVPHEPRVRAVVAYSAGFVPTSPQAVIDRILGLLPRVRVPLLMLGSQNDFFFPEEHQRAWFEAVGTPDEHKYFRLYDSGHWPLPFGEVLRETVDFLDRYAGSEPVPITPYSP